MNARHAGHRRLVLPAADTAWTGVWLAAQAAAAVLLGMSVHGQLSGPQATTHHLPDLPPDIESGRVA
ncbi:hypothetical protein ACFXKW_18895 [Streptomyces sp. NPDC059193]|uniref:hypothetical protein n=1 Tax=Streptomyces sp. NPDC059193 TaxID=3346763 RepID=UPI0036D11349